MLQHCPKPLVDKLKAMSTWDDVRNDQDAIGLLCLIRDVTHQHDETRHGSMALVQSDIDLYTCAMTETEDLMDWVQVFMALVATIDAHQGNPGFHGGLRELHFKNTMKADGISDPKVLDPAKKSKYVKKATKSSREEYLACMMICIWQTGNGLGG